MVPNNRSAVAETDVAAWQAKGVIDPSGIVGGCASLFRAADCVVLLSYREGLPHSLLEASAMGKPPIASDVPGCREIADDGEMIFSAKCARRIRSRRRCSGCWRSARTSAPRWASARGTRSSANKIIV